MSGVMRLILDRDDGSARGDDDFFSVARTIPLVAATQHVSIQVLWLKHVNWVNLPLIPSAVTPWLTAFKAYSIRYCVVSRGFVIYKYAFRS